MLSEKLACFQMKLYCMTHHNWCPSITCSLIQIWHKTNYYRTSASTSTFRKHFCKRKKKKTKSYAHGFQDLSFATQCTNNIANGWLTQHGVRGSSLKHMEVRCPGVSAVSPKLLNKQGCEFSNYMRYSELSVCDFILFFPKYNDQKHTHTKEEKKVKYIIYTSASIHEQK